jgi:hypothetical protein
MTSPDTVLDPTLTEAPLPSESEAPPPDEQPTEPVIVEDEPAPSTYEPPAEPKDTATCLEYLKPTGDGLKRELGKMFLVKVVKPADLPLLIEAFSRTDVYDQWAMNALRVGIMTLNDSRGRAVLGVAGFMALLDERGQAQLGVKSVTTELGLSWSPFEGSAQLPSSPLLSSKISLRLSEWDNGAIDYLKASLGLEDDADVVRYCLAYTCLLNFQNGPQ